jgi:5-methylthioadenosine/S-adenosylhomocysteine deaminase
MPVDLLVCGEIITMDPERRVISGGAVAVDDGAIIEVGDAAALRAANPGATIVGGADSLVTPGLINAHQHLTGDRLVRSCIPEDIDSESSIFDWAVPIHSHHTPDDDELTATLGALEALRNGVTTTIEAGTVAHPDRVAAALDRVGMRARIGTWGWDIEDAPYAGPVDEVLDRLRSVLASRPAGGMVEGGVTLVGHDLMSDELLVEATALARERGVGMTFHISPHGRDPVSYLERTGERPIVHFDRLGVLGPHLLLAHAVHLDEAEIGLVVGSGAAIATCPWAYLRLAQGFALNHRHDWFLDNGGRLALGADAENAGDAIDLLRVAALFIGLVRDRSEDATSITSAEGFALATVGGAEAVGLGDRVGSIEVGKRADLVVHDLTRPQFTPRSTDLVRQLVWASDGRTVADVVVDGRVVVRDGECITVDVAGLRAEAADRQAFMLDQVGGAS